MPKRQSPRPKRVPSAKLSGTSPPEDRRLLDRAVVLERARASLWEYQKLRDPKFFMDSRPHLKQISDTLQGVFEGKLLKADGTPYRKIVLSIPPRHGKSYSIAGFNQWAYGHRRDTRIAVISYNDILTGRFSQGVRDTIDEQRITDDQIVYGDIFPEVRLKYGDSARGIWALDGEHFSFLATSFGGTMTGVGFNVGIIDDPIKLHSEALNDDFLEAQFRWYTDAYLSRLEEDAMQIIVMTRWATRDLAGRVMEAEPGEWLEIRQEAYEQMSYLPPEMSTAEYVKSYGEVGWLYACVTKRAEAVASADLHLYRLDSDSNQVEVFDHPLLALLEKPNHYSLHRRLSQRKNVTQSRYGHIKYTLNPAVYHRLGGWGGCDNPFSEVETGNHRVERIT